MSLFIAKFETNNGSIFTRDIEATNLKDATIEASTMEEKENIELLSIDLYK